MKIAIISAMDKERNLILPLLENKEILTVDGLEIAKGNIGNHEIISSKCRIGKVNAAVNTYKIINRFSPDLIINSGVAGSLSDKMEIGDILVADYAAYYDVWCGPGTNQGEADGLEVFMECDTEIIKIAHNVLDGKRLQVGLICSGDKFIDSADEAMEIKRLFPEAVAVDMESAAIGHVCEMEGVNFNIIRIISDAPGNGHNVEEYNKFWKEAPEKSFYAIKSILNAI